MSKGHGTKARHIRHDSPPRFRVSSFPNLQSPLNVLDSSDQGRRSTKRGLRQSEKAPWWRFTPQRSSGYGPEFAPPQLQLELAESRRRGAFCKRQFSSLWDGNPEHSHGPPSQTTEAVEAEGWKSQEVGPGQGTMPRGHKEPTWVRGRRAGNKMIAWHAYAAK